MLKSDKKNTAQNIDFKKASSYRNPCHAMPFQCKSNSIKLQIDWLICGINCTSKTIMPETPHCKDIYRELCEITILKRSLAKRKVIPIFELIGKCLWSHWASLAQHHIVGTQQTTSAVQSSPILGNRIWIDPIHCINSFKSPADFVFWLKARWLCKSKSPPFILLHKDNLTSSLPMIAWSECSYHDGCRKAITDC